MEVESDGLEIRLGDDRWFTISVSTAKSIMDLQIDYCGPPGSWRIMSSAGSLTRADLSVWGGVQCSLLDFLIRHIVLIKEAIHGIPAPSLARPHMRFHRLYSTEDGYNSRAVTSGDTPLVA